MNGEPAFDADGSSESRASMSRSKRSLVRTISSGAKPASMARRAFARRRGVDQRTGGAQGGEERRVRVRLLCVAHDVEQRASRATRAAAVGR
jgi:hypothetical protein